MKLWQHFHTTDVSLQWFPAEIKTCLPFHYASFEVVHVKGLRKHRVILINSHRSLISTLSQSLSPLSCCTVIFHLSLPTAFFFNKLGRQTGLMRFSRGTPHGNVSFVHILCKVKKDMKSEKKGGMASPIYGLVIVFPWFMNTHHSWLS